MRAASTYKVVNVHQILLYIILQYYCEVLHKQLNNKKT